MLGTQAALCQDPLTHSQHPNRFSPDYEMEIKSKRDCFLSSCHDEAVIKLDVTLRTLPHTLVYSCWALLKTGSHLLHYNLFAVILKNSVLRIIGEMIN